MDAVEDYLVEGELMSGPVIERHIRSDGLVLDIVRGSLEFETQAVELTRCELALLVLLLENRGTFVAIDTIKQQILTLQAADASVRNLISSLRSKLNALTHAPPLRVQTQRGLGYGIGTFRESAFCESQTRHLNAVSSCG